MEMSFWQLIDKYRIEIPVLQRDYAQGRQNAKAEDVRRNIISKIKGALCLNARGSKDVGKNNLSFDFVYGRIEADKFIPFDGQQRLTTLFLLYKYVVNRCGNNDEYLEKLKKFSYATRRSSREFCEKFVMENVIPSDDAMISQFIVDQPWYYLEWGRDPTISGMLIMLDEIHGRLKFENNFSDIFRQLTSQYECPIRFHFVDMGANKLKDDIYIKMNARGKVLTPFENFKASLEMYLESESNKTGNVKSVATAELKRMRNPKEGIDGRWLDMFWRIANPKPEVNEKTLPDPLMLSFINRHFINLYHSNIDKFMGDGKDNIDDSLKSFPENDRFVSWDQYERILGQCSIEKAITPIFNIWERLSTEEKIVQGINVSCNAVWSRSYVKPVASDDTDAGDNKGVWDIFHGKKANDEHFEAYPSRVAFYAVMLFFEKGIKYDDDSLSAWMRVVWNIIENSTIDSQETYHSALALVMKLAEGCHSIYSILVKGEDQLGLGRQYHAQDQVQEEIEKARQILDEGGELRAYKGTCREFVGKKWKDVIEIAEASAFFKGAIRFLYRDENGNMDWENFDTRYQSVKKYFDKKGVNKVFRRNALLLRAFLARIGDKISDALWFGNGDVFWRNGVLLNDGYKSVVSSLLLNIVTKENVLPLNSKIPDWVRDEGLLFDAIRNDNDQNGQWHILSNWQKGSAALTRYCKKESRHLTCPHQVIPLDLTRNDLLAGMKSVQRRGTKYFIGWVADIDFEYNGHCFQWLGEPDYSGPRQEQDIYLMYVKADGTWDYQKRKYYKDGLPDPKNYYCFNVDAHKIRTQKEFLKELVELVQEFEKEQQEQSCTNSK